MQFEIHPMLLGQSAWWPGSDLHAPPHSGAPNKESGQAQNPMLPRVSVRMEEVRRETALASTLPAARK